MKFQSLTSSVPPRMGRDGAEVTVPLVRTVLPHPTKEGEKVPNNDESGDDVLLYVRDTTVT